MPSHLRALLLATSAVLAGCPGAGTTPPEPPPVARAELVAIGAVYGIAVAPDGTAYLGGDFTAIGPYTGPLVLLDPETGLAAPAPAFAAAPRMSGWVTAAAPDGRGGWYVGGSFRLGPGADRASLVRVRADATVDPDFAASLDGSVGALAVGGGVVYVGGGFDHVGGAPRHHLAAVDAATGAVTGWDPTHDPSAIPGLCHPTEMLLPPSVNALALGNGLIYAGGSARSGTSSSGWVAAIDPAGVVSAWSPTITGGGVSTLAVHGGTLHAGGWFLTVDSQPREGLAAFDGSGALSSWNPGARSVTALAIVQGTLYAGGYFTRVNGASHPGIVAFDPSGAPSTWNPGLGGPVTAMAESGGALHVGGSFRTIGGVRRMNLAAFDASGALLPWNPMANAGVLALAVSGGRLLAGGVFTSLGGTSRNGLAALDREGRLTPWDPDVGGTRATFPGVRALALSGDRLFVGGAFETIAGTARSNLAAVDLQGQVLDVTPAVDGPVYALATFSGGVLAGGQFSQAGAVPRQSLVAFDPAAAGSVLGFDPGLVGTRGERPVVHALAARGSTVYAGGRFARAGVTPRRNGAAFDASGALLAWDPGAAGVDSLYYPPAIHALAPTDRGVYVGGTFSSLGGAARSGVGLLDAASGTVLPWDPAAAATALAPSGFSPLATFGLLPRGDTVYIGGTLSNLAGAWRAAAAVDATTGAVSSWNPGGLDTVYALAAWGDRLLIGDRSGFSAVAR